MRIVIQKPAKRYCSDFNLTVENKIFSLKKIEEFGYKDTYNRGSLDTLNYLSTNVDLRKIITKIPGVFKSGLLFKGTYYNNMDDILTKYTTYNHDKDLILVIDLIKARIKVDSLFASILYNLFKQFNKSIEFLYLNKSTGGVKCCKNSHSYYGVIYDGMNYNGFNIFGKGITSVYNELYLKNRKRKRY